MDDIPAEGRAAEDLHDKLDRAQMLSELRLMHCKALQSEVERLDSQRDGLVPAEDCVQIELECDGRVLRMERELQVRSQHMEQMLSQAQLEIERLRHQERLLLGEIDRIYKSRSVRLTAPLRKIRQISQLWRK
ncbi:hypothetical protein [Sulfitobacter sp. CS16]|jgi:hypothetical protein|uniref:hypothetical protein n=1 Tax=Sulfitobacter sp. CS16 TaxID=3368573 RepID=UPI003744F7EA